MIQDRVVFDYKAAELGLAIGQIRKFFETPGVDLSSSIDADRQVRRALERLEEDEMEFVIRFYFIGESINKISEKSGRRICKLEALHKRAIRKLKTQLNGFVKKKYGIKAAVVKSCALCLSPNRAAIEKIINSKSEHST